jgi:hypothetical protein
VRAGGCGPGIGRVVRAGNEQGRAGKGGQEQSRVRAEAASQGVREGGWAGLAGGYGKARSGREGEAAWCEHGGQSVQ